MPDSDGVIGVTSEEVLTVVRPGKGNTFWGLTFGNFWLQFVLQLLGLQVEDLDRLGGGSGQPESVWSESQSVDFGTGWQGVKNRLGVDVPQDDDTVLTGGSTQGSVWGDGDGGNETVVTNEVSQKLGVI